MTRSDLRVLATPGPSTQSLVAMLRGSLPADVIDASALSSPDAAEHLNDGPAARLLVFIAHPADTAALAIAAGDDVERALTDWCAAARKLLRQIQRHPSRYLIVDADEILASPQLFSEALGNWHETLGRFSPSEAATPSIDPLMKLLGRIAADNDVAARRLFAELQARCAMLGQSELPPSHDWRAAVRHQQRHIEQRVEEQTRWSSRLEDLQEVLRKTRDESDDWKRHAEASKQESSMLALQLEQAQQELHVRHEELAKARDDAEKRECDSLLISLQLEQAQEELDTLYKSRLRTRARANAVSIYAEGLRFLDTSTEAPFRHLHIGLQQVHVGDRHWESLEVRLVEHHGRPGIAFFGTGQAREPLASWQVSGREGIREFVLLVPSDEAGQSRLAALGTTDWHMVAGIADLLVRELPRIGGDVATEWAFIARRLQADLHGIEPRLRYDACSMQEDDGSEGSYRIEFSEVLFGSQWLGHARLRWQPDSGALEWLAPDDGQPLPLSGWPARDDRSRCAAYRIPTSRNDRPAARKAWWAAQPARSRALLLAILEALPEATRRRAETSRFALAAAKLLADVRRLQRPRTLRSAVKSLLRRT